MNEKYLKYLNGSFHVDEQLNKLLLEKSKSTKPKYKKNTGTPTTPQAEFPLTFKGKGGKFSAEPTFTQPPKTSPETTANPSGDNTKEFKFSTPHGDILSIINATIDTLIKEIPRGENTKQSGAGSRFHDIGKKSGYDKFSALKQHGWFAPSISGEKHKEEWDQFRKNISLDEEQEHVGGNSFLYNVHSKFNKYPGKFAIVVGNTKPIVLSKDGKPHSYQVIWAWVGGRNDIFVRGNGASVMLFRVWDDQANPRNDSFNIEKIINQAIPSFEKNILQKANPKEIKWFYEQVINNSEKLDMLHRVLYATVLRKSMEFKAANPSMHVDGKDLTIGGKEITPPELKNYIYHMTDDDAIDNIIQVLEKKKYFGFYRTLENEIKTYVEVRKTLKQKLESEFDESKLIPSINELIKKAKDKIGDDNATSREIYDAAIEIFDSESKSKSKKTDQ